MGVIGRKHFLNFGLLNVDGLSDSSLEDVKSALSRKSLDLCVLLETKRRYEEVGSDIGIDGYSVKEIRRSDAAGDKGGGGIAYYVRQIDRLIFKEHSTSIDDPALYYVQNERFWITTESLSMKTAFCGLYLGCQYGDDRHSDWNTGLLSVVQSEAMFLKSRG